MVDPVDALVEGKIRELRRASGITLETLAKAIGTTFQQVQKHEKGSTRVSASRLQGIASG